MIGLWHALYKPDGLRAIRATAARQRVLFALHGDQGTAGALVGDDAVRQNDSAQAPPMAGSGVLPDASLLFVFVCTNPGKMAPAFAIGAYPAYERGSPSFVQSNPKSSFMTDADLLVKTDDFDTLGGRLSRAREAKDFSLQQLAKLVGVEGRTLKAWAVPWALAFHGCFTGVVHHRWKNRMPVRTLPRLNRPWHSLIN